MTNTHAPTKFFTPLTLTLLLTGAMTQLIRGDWLDYAEDKLQGIPLPIQATAMSAWIVLITACSPGALAPFIYFKF